MENTKSKITVNLYGSKIKATLNHSDPTLEELFEGFIFCLERHDFTIGDIHRAMIFNLLGYDGDTDEHEEDTFNIPPGFEAFIKGRENGKK
jgi:hypothetical protein